MKNRIKELRLKHNLTLKELSSRLKETDTNISSDALGKYERGDRNPKIDKWKALSDFSDVPITYLQGTTSYIRKYELWVCSKCRKHFFVTEEPKYCPYCGSTKQLCYGISKTISF